MLLVFVCTCASAQSIVGSHSFEIGGGINLFGLIASHGGPDRELGPGVFFEYRYAFAEHFDVGGRIGIQVWRFRIALECDFALKHGLSSEETSTALNLSFTF